MKRLLIILLLLVSCSKEILEVEKPVCECDKIVTEKVSTTYIQNGVIKIRVIETEMYREIVPCQEETSGHLDGDLYYEIICE